MKPWKLHFINDHLFQRRRSTDETTVKSQILKTIKTIKVDRAFIWCWHALKPTSC